MSAQMKPQVPQLEVVFEPLTLARLDDVMLIERASYDCPWSRHNFTDSLDSGYAIQLLVARPTGSGSESDIQKAGARLQRPILGYFVAMRGVDEVHLLNLTVASSYRQQGWALVLLEALVLWSRSEGAETVWLEVRGSNLRAQQIYSRYGFASLGVRKNYYPPADGRREDAFVMSFRL